MIQENIDRAIWAGVGALAVAAITGTVKIIRAHLIDRQKVSASLSLTAELDLIQQVGCPGLLLRVCCRSRRPVKISGAKLSGKGVNIMQSLQQGFGGQMGYAPLPGSTQTAALKLLARTKRNDANGWVLQRDDVCHFYLPMLFPLGIFLELPSEEVGIEVDFFDGSSKKVLCGLTLIEHLRNLLSAYGNRPWQLDPQIDIPFIVTVDSLTPGDSSLVGQTNPNEIRFKSRHEKDTKG